MAEDPKQNIQRYEEDLPADRTNFAKAWKLLESYSKIPPAEIDAHVKAIRDKAFDVFHYPCIGRWRFLDLYITTAPEYPDILARLKAGESLLDVGCCFGHILRQLTYDGVPSKNLAGTDLRPEFVELGYELFRDKGTLESQFVTGDALDPSNKSLDALDGKFDIVHSASFFHLFSWDDQVKAGERIVKFFKADAKALLVGRQVGTRTPKSLGEYDKKRGNRYYHNVETFQVLWDEIGKKTETKWKVTGDFIDLENSVDGFRTILRFAVSKAI